MYTKMSAHDCIIIDKDIEIVQYIHTNDVDTHNDSKAQNTKYNYYNDLPKGDEEPNEELEIKRQMMTKYRRRATTTIIITRGRNIIDSSAHDGMRMIVHIHE